ncbi:hypothetical protein CA54_16610 [Symmachiella macrocystis]|uniref:Uncharacterized protein n=1 Tax=Symmachiella macrocystis TaxID=2527985 RepID=A0A5C6BLE6_9PLAN|nr:hypothetical protein CA54_16610 [Symmachiella macrocystis]
MSNEQEKQTSQNNQPSIHSIVATVTETATTVTESCEIPSQIKAAIQRSLEGKKGK